jgi:hypothetical protein
VQAISGGPRGGAWPRRQASGILLFRFPTPGRDQQVRHHQRVRALKKREPRLASMFAIFNRLNIQERLPWIEALKPVPWWS